MALRSQPPAAAANSRTNCHYCSRPGHMKRDCRKKKADEKAGRPPPRGDTPQPPAAALVCNGADHEGLAMTASHSNGGVMFYDSCCTHRLVKDSRFLEKNSVRPQCNAWVATSHLLSRGRAPQCCSVANRPRRIAECAICANDSSQPALEESGTVERCARGSRR